MHKIYIEKVFKVLNYKFILILLYISLYLLQTNLKKNNYKNNTNKKNKGKNQNLFPIYNYLFLNRYLITY